MKQKKRRYEVFSFYDHTGIEKHLAKMAEKGWLISKIAPLYWEYTRMEPSKLTFTVTYYPKASEFDPEPPEEQQTLWDFCEAAGWKLATTSAQMQIFYTEKENPVPIDTDAKIQVETVHKVAKKNYLWPNYLLLAVSILQLFLHVDMIQQNPVRAFSSNSGLFSPTCFTFVLLLSLSELLSYYTWHHKAKKAAETTGEFVSTRGNSVFSKLVLLFILLLFPFCLFTFSNQTLAAAALSFVVFDIGLILLINRIKTILKRRKASRDTNFAVTLFLSIFLAVILGSVFTACILSVVRQNAFNKKQENARTYEYNGHTYTLSDDDIPLKIEDFTDTAGAEYSYEFLDNDSSLLLSCQWAVQSSRYDQNPEKDRLGYTITRVKAPFLYDICFDYYIKLLTREDEEPQLSYHAIELDAAPWQAEKVYQQYHGNIPNGTYLVCYKDKIVNITFYWQPTEEEIRAAGAKLKDL